ncbi:MAG: DMT family transporter [bacterium]
MNINRIFQLFLLSAVWGASFLFIRIAVPSLGPALLIEFRVGFAALFLLITGFFLHKKLATSENWRYFSILALFNSVIPFLLVAYSAQTLSVSMLAVLNSTSPAFGVLIDTLWHKKPLAVATIIGLFSGMSGVYVLSGLSSGIPLETTTLIAIAASLLAALSYGIASSYVHSTKRVDPFVSAHGSMWAASLMIIPLLFFFPAPEHPDSTVMLSVIALGVISTGFAYILYFQLIKDIGASSALTVTYLIPFFAILWGYLFLDEKLGWHIGVGLILVLSGTALVTRHE